MKIYLVMDYFEDGSDTPTLVYGCFSSEEQAKDIANDLRKSFKENNEDTEVVIKELYLNKPTDNYYWFMTH